MLSRKFALLLVVVVSLVAFAGNASAVPSACMVDKENSFNSQPTTGTPAVATYNWNQSPWLYFLSPSSVLTYSVSWWDYTGDIFKTPSVEITSGTGNVWHGFSNFADWAAIRKTGDWAVRADYSHANGYGSTGEVPFKINAVPEPLSSALFLLGGGAIAVLKLRKKKTL